MTKDYTMPDAEGEALDPNDLYAVPPSERLDSDGGHGSDASAGGGDTDGLDDLPDGDVIESFE